MDLLLVLLMVFCAIGFFYLPYRDDRIMISFEEDAKRITGELEDSIKEISNQ